MTKKIITVLFLSTQLFAHEKPKILMTWQQQKDIVQTIKFCKQDRYQGFLCGNYYADIVIDNRELLSDCQTLHNKHYTDEAERAFWQKWNSVQDETKLRYSSY